MAFPKIEGYVVTEKLGSGSYSTVYKAFTKVGGRAVVAVKCVEKARVRGAAADNLLTEIRLLKTLQHPHIVAMREFTWDDKHVYIVMEYCSGGDLSNYIRRYGRVPEKQVLYFLQQLASALKFLREKGVAHMDLKPHNLLLQRGDDHKYLLKVADFGFAQYLSPESQQRLVRGSPLYMAPEVLRGQYTAAADLWSVGVIMYECLFGRAPYSSASLRELVHKIQSQAPMTIPAGSSVSAGCRDLLTRLLRHDPEERISHEEFFAHPYLDLEHMPSKENYDKAVSLIKRAVALDAAGDIEEAFGLYCASLRYLVPAVQCEPDGMRRQALRDKLTSYMERAEQLKARLRGGGACGGGGGGSPTPPPPAPASPAAPPPGCRAPPDQTTSSDNGEFHHRHPRPPPGDALPARAGAAPDTDTCACNTHVLNKRDSLKRTDSTADRPGPGGGGGGGVGARLRRLFGKQPVPYLDTGDPTEEPTRGDKLPQAEEPGGDGCRIT